MNGNKTLIWDLPTRIFHWLLVVAVAYAWFAVEILEDMEQHFYAGYTVLVLVSFRILWGFFGTRYARFTSLPLSISEIKSSLHGFLSSTPSGHAGHNPLGSLSVLALLFLLSTQLIFGLFANDEYYFGPLSQFVSGSTSSLLTELHELNFEALKVLIFVHLAAVLYYQFYKKERLIGAMVTGKKDDHAQKMQGIDGSRLALAVAILLCCIVVVFLLASLE